MISLKKAAQDVLSEYFKPEPTRNLHRDLSVPINALRKALQAEPEKPVGEICLTPQAFNIGANIFDCTIQFVFDHTPKQGDKLYTTPPSIDALIAEIEALPSWNLTPSSDFISGRYTPAHALIAILDKYRSKP